MTGDDKAYMALMAKYKELRGREGEAAVRYLEAAMKLREQGNVSKDAVIGAAYL
jgi:hypothetical protein